MIANGGKDVGRSGKKIDNFVGPIPGGPRLIGAIVIELGPEELLEGIEVVGREGFEEVVNLLAEFEGHGLVPGRIINRSIG